MNSNQKCSIQILFDFSLSTALKRKLKDESSYLLRNLSNWIMTAELHERQALRLLCATVQGAGHKQRSFTSLAKLFPTCKCH